MKPQSVIGSSPLVFLFQYFFIVSLSLFESEMKQ